jgi:hypothetical protein
MGLDIHILSRSRLPAVPTQESLGGFQMSITPSSAPQSEPGPSKAYDTGSAGVRNAQPQWAVMALAAVMVAGLGGSFYYSYMLNQRLEQLSVELQTTLNAQKEVLEEVGSRLDDGDARAAELQAQVGQTQEVVGVTQTEIRRARQQTAAELERQRRLAQQVAQQAAQQDEQLASQLGQLHQEQIATKGNLGSLSTDVAGVRGDVKTTQTDLEATRSQLQRVIGDLGVQSGLVAHNRTELDELKALGERDYVEFDLLKRSKVQRVGNIQLELKRTDTKRQKYTMNLIVDDRTIEKKDKNVYEPVQFYQEGFRAPTEVVVNRIDRDRIVGYISTPKRKENRQPLRSSF